MGQVVTGGRLEVTALGDEMNECARIQATARDGSVLATKALLEQLAPAESEAVGIDPDRSPTARSPSSRAPTRSRSETPARSRSPSGADSAGPRDVAVERQQAAVEDEDLGDDRA